MDKKVKSREQMVIPGFVLLHLAHINNRNADVKLTLICLWLIVCMESIIFTLARKLLIHLTCLLCVLYVWLRN